MSGRPSDEVMLARAIKRDPVIRAMAERREAIIWEIVKIDGFIEGYDACRAELSAPVSAE